MKRFGRISRSICALTALTMVLIAAPVVPAVGTLTLLEQKLWVSGGAIDDFFGISVAMTSDTLVVGAYGEGTSGSAYVYRRSGDSWSLEQELQPEDSPLGGGFGMSVAVSGDTIAVGTPYVTSQTGAVYIFTRSGTTWTQQQKLTASDGESEDYFGLVVDLDGDTVLAGAPGDEGRVGSAYVFTRASGVWTPQQKITATGGVVGDEFGYAAALDGDTAIIGAPYLDVAANDSVGAAYVFTRSGNTWAQGQTLGPSTTSAYQYYGNAIDIDAGTAIVGGIGTYAAYVYTESGGTWDLQQKLYASDGLASYFSNAVGLAGDTAIVGSDQHTHEAIGSGSAYVYTRAAGVWTEQVELLASDRVAGDRYGMSVACTEARFAVGAPWADPVAVSSGAVYIYQPSNTAPVAVDDSYDAVAGEVLVVPLPGVLDNDSDPDGDALSANPESQPSHGELQLEEDGSFTYTPDAGFTGTDSFTYTANDGTDVSNVATVTLTVTDSLPDGSFRVAGDNRYLTSIEASKRGFPAGAKTVVIAKGTDWPDALGGSALAGAAGGPLLLTRPDALPSEVAAEIKRLKATKAYILGSTASISAGVASAIDALPLVTEVKRLEGPNRYETARKVADETIRLLGAGYGGHAFVATGLNFPDATAAAPLAAALGRPILLPNINAGTVYVPAKTTKVVILGSTAAVPATVETYLNKLLGDANVDRKGSTNRYATAALVAQLGVDAGMRWDGTGLATGLNFPDALSGGAMLGELRSVMLLTRPDVLSGEAYAKLYANRAVIDTLFIFGDENAVSAAVEKNAKTAATVTP
jgi:VCBS repeat-containing protein